MTSELRPAVEVWAEAEMAACHGAEYAAAAVIEADREAVRAEQAAELAKFKALSETLAGALEHITDIEPDPANMGRFHDIANEALRQYKEARDAS